MSLLNRFTIRARLIILVISFTLVALLIGAIGAWTINHGRDDLTQMHREFLGEGFQVAGILQRLGETRMHMLLALQHDPRNPAVKLHRHPTALHIKRIRKHSKEIAEQWAALHASVMAGDLAEFGSAFDEQLKRFNQEALAPTLAALEADDYASAVTSATKTSQKLYVATRRAAEALLQAKVDQGNAMIAVADQRYQSNFAAFSALLIGGVAFALLIAAATIRGLSLAVRALDETAVAMAEGHLAVRADETGADELASVGRSFNRVGDKFRETIEELSLTIARLTESTAALSTITQTTNQAIDRQRHGTDQMVTAVHELSETVQGVAQSADEAAVAAESADAASESGKLVVGRTRDANHVMADDVQRAASVIAQLSDDSQQIGAVLEVIRGIAEQTNLLALNAAIEAARAGEQGRGFAVVADEVRTLASRTQQSTAEIQSMIERLQGRSREAVAAMEDGTRNATACVEQVTEAEQALAQISVAVSRINSLNAQIAAASQQQRANAESITGTVDGISSVADDTARDATRTLEAVTQLTELTTRLQRFSEGFATTDSR